MTRNRIDDLNCSLADSLNLIGEWWTILILRESFFGTRRFEDFQQHLGIARNILTARLGTLCDNGILERVPVKQGAKRHEYRLTTMGRDLLTVIIALTQWGDRWLRREQGAPVKFVERSSGEVIPEVSVLSKDGRQLKTRDLMMIPGPGATDETRERLQLITQAWESRNQAS
ncbi:MAG: helix-turn-helix domain-containing protein [Gammaproteobacteria bacterium]|nr:MAG: helix-turn-helix domain-containing protein [Gammaproteobacteria bacterium]